MREASSNEYILALWRVSIVTIEVGFGEFTLGSLLFIDSFLL